MEPDEHNSVQWVAPTHVRAERSVDWYWALGILAICGIIASVLWGNVLFAAIIALSALMLGTLAARQPREFNVEVSEQGITIDNDFYPYPSIRSFWINTRNPEIPRLSLETSSVLHPHAVVILESPESAEELRTYLERFIPEDEHRSPGMLLLELFGL